MRRAVQVKFYEKNLPVYHTVKTNSVQDNITITDKLQNATAVTAIPKQQVAELTASITVADEVCSKRNSGVRTR